MKNSVTNMRSDLLSAWCQCDSGHLAPMSSSCLQYHDPVQIMGQNSESEPRIGPSATAQSTVAPSVLPAPQADRGFLSTAPALLSTEPPLALIRGACCAGSSFHRKAALFHACSLEERFVGFRAKAAIGGDDARCSRHCLSVTRIRGGQQAAVFGISHVHFVVRD